jgi:hypothetical protein
VSETFVFASEERARPNRELLAQVLSPSGKRAYVLTVRDVSRSGALIELSGFRPSWLVPGRELELTISGEGEDESVDLRGPVARVVTHGDDPVFAVRFDGPSRRSRRYIERLVESGRTVRARTAL